MANEQRIRGQEVQVRITQGNTLLATITAVKSFNVGFSNRVLTDQYIGETTVRKDDIFEGIKGSMTLHPESSEALTLVQFVIDRASRRVALTNKINISARLSFPNGQRPRINIPDVQFGEIPLNVGSRDAYVDLVLNYEAARAEIILA